MASILLTCPESAHLEKIEYVDHPLGMLIVRCSAYPGDCPPACPRTCAKRLDQKRQLHQKRLADGTVLFATSCLRRC
jgi:hypothetical protein